MVMQLTDLTHTHIHTRHHKRQLACGFDDEQFFFFSLNIYFFYFTCKHALQAIHNLRDYFCVFGLCIWENDFGLFFLSFSRSRSLSNEWHSWVATRVDRVMIIMHDIEWTTRKNYNTEYFKHTFTHNLCLFAIAIFMCKSFAILFVRISHTQKPIQCNFLIQNLLHSQFSLFFLRFEQQHLRKYKQMHHICKLLIRNFKQTFYTQNKLIGQKNI